jgi:nucleotide-binding universal stress UspA family protein
MEKEAKKNLEKAKVSVAKTKIPIKTVVKQGNAADIIVETADKMRVGMIVIGSHGRQGVQRFLLGSISLNVVEQSRRPVLVVK